MTPLEHVFMLDEDTILDDIILKLVGATGSHLLM